MHVSRGVSVPYQLLCIVKHVELFLGGCMVRVWYALYISVCMDDSFSDHTCWVIDLCIAAWCRLSVHLVCVVVVVQCAM